MNNVNNDYLDKLNLMRNKLVKYWKNLKKNSKTLEIYKSNKCECINRYTEMCLFNSRKFIMKAIIELENVIIYLDKKN